ncbi:hypothetical protein DAEQUDRAFT_727685 [Daedalea quercina L-15889]|uniref:Uncharacterized protein n=1 Tax=Daedalea quercina L-15889 TaxID=1314783 RepID=A0A165PS74_9APHY|nr:hypothetical protein DAEQUDRAFT_727685 [Daedalea quercina L-15889]
MGLEFSDECLRSRYMHFSGTGRLLVPQLNSWGPDVCVEYVVMQREILVDPTREGLLGRVMRRRERPITSRTHQYAVWDDIL